jgi:hypothetical protein
MVSEEHQRAGAYLEAAPVMAAENTPSVAAHGSAGEPGILRSPCRRRALTLCSVPAPGFRRSIDG